jgi:hypothetical protein
MSDVKATWPGRIEHGNIAAKTNMTVTSTERLFSRALIQDESGDTPSRATTKMSHEEDVRKGMRTRYAP